MKRFGAMMLVLAIMLVLTACGGNGGGNVSQSNAAESTESPAQPARSLLETAFDSGKPTMTEKSSAILQPAPEDLVITDGMVAFAAEWGDGRDREELETEGRNALQQEKLTLVSRSPAGNSGIVQAETGAYALYEGKYLAIYPSGPRSVEDALAGGPSADEVTRLWRYWMSFSYSVGSLLHTEGIVYSPDGRYAAIPSSGDKFYELRMDPIIIDLSTGEMIQTAAYMRHVDVRTAAFSADNRYYWYVLSGSFDEGNRLLCRYDLETGETEICCGGTANLYQPDLAELRDGSWMMFSSMENSLVIASPTEGTWSLSKTMYEEVDSSPARLLYSRESGQACLLLVKDDSGTAFRIFQPDNNFAGLDRLLCVTKGSHEIVSLSAEEFRNAIQACNLETTDARGKTRKRFMLDAFSYELIDSVFMSPDGNYLLMGTHSRETMKDDPVASLFLVRLSDLAVRNVQGVSPESFINEAKFYTFYLPFEWNSDEMIIYTEEGWKIFTFTAGE